MNILVVNPTGTFLCVSCFKATDGALHVYHQLKCNRDSERLFNEKAFRVGAFQKENTPGHINPLAFDIIALRLPYGDPSIQGPVLVTPTVLASLEANQFQAPVHLPISLKIIAQLKRELPGVPLILLSETSFFNHLPEREYTCAVEAQGEGQDTVSSYGYHGLYHQAACNVAACKQPDNTVKNPVRLLSICLDPLPEIVAAIGHTPIMVTSGPTPLHGLPGHTSCGELDPSIPLLLAEKLGWGPEETNSVLTQQSGLFGLFGAPLTFEELFQGQTPAHQKIREFFLYRVLLACGAGLAALGRLEAIIFSGRYVELADKVGPWLKARLSFLEHSETGLPERFILTETIEEILATQAMHFNL